MPDIYILNDVAHFYGNTRAFWVDHLLIEKGSIVGLIGPNGSGKSTLLKILAFVQKPTRGTILFKQKPASVFSEAVRFNVTLLTQEPYLLKRTVMANIAYGLKIRGRKNNLKIKVHKSLESVGLDPEKFAGRKWNELSGGEAQRVALAARLVLEPEVLLLDEPTASVDETSGQYIREAAFNAREKWGTTLIMASHDHQWLYSVCDTTLQLYDGKIFGNGTDTILVGPWDPEENGMCSKKLSEDQKIVVSAPPNPEAYGKLAQKDLQFSQNGRLTDYENGLNGTVFHLVLQKGTPDIIATVYVANRPFTLKLTPDQIKNHGIYPGRTLYLHFKADAVNWL